MTSNTKKENDMSIVKRSNRIWFRHPVKLTALLYLKEALLDEVYEQCESLVKVARDFGATDREIGHLLEDPRREPE